MVCKGQGARIPREAEAMVERMLDRAPEPAGLVLGAALWSHTGRVGIGEPSRGRQ